MVEAQEVAHRNEVCLVGRVSRLPEKRRLPSGDPIVTVHVVVERGERRHARGPRLDAIECVAWLARPRRAVGAWLPGDVVEVVGPLRRRFHRAEGRPVSRYHVEVARARRVVRTT